MPSLVSAGGIVLNPTGEILVVSQKSSSSWSLPKGHVDPGETAVEAARREIYEESGISSLELLDDLGSYERYPIGQDGSHPGDERKRIHMFLFRTRETRLRPLDPDNPEARWEQPELAAKLLTHERDREFVRAWWRTSRR